MTASYVTYIDESGDDGFRFGNGSSEWFILSAAIFRKSTEPEQVKVVDEVIGALNRKKSKDLHFVELKHEQRILYLSKVRQCRMRCITVAIHKPSITDRGTFQLKNKLYHYAVRLLIERATWLCNEYHGTNDEGDGATELIFSHRRTTSYEAIKEYLLKLKTEKLTEIEWAAIDINAVSALPHKTRKGLWLADCVASSFFKGLEKNIYGLTEGRYAEMLQPLVWRQKKEFIGTGVKIFPSETIQRLDLTDLHAWLNRTYKLKAQ